MNISGIQYGDLPTNIIGLQYLIIMSQTSKTVIKIKQSFVFSTTNNKNIFQL